MSQRRGRSRRSRAAARAATAVSPSGRSDLSRVGLFLVALEVALLPVFFDPNSMVAFQTPKTLLGQALATLLAGALAATYLTEGRRAFRVTPLHWAVLALAAVYVLATLFALNTTIALRGSADRGLGLIAIAQGVLTFVAVPVYVRTRTDALVLGVAFFGAAIPVLIYQAMQVTGLDPVPWEGFEAGPGRQMSTLGNATSLGQYIASITVAALALALQRDEALPRNARIALLVLGVAAAAGALGAGTRGTVIGLAGAALVGGAVALMRLWPRARRLLPGALAVATAAVAAALVLTPAGALAGDAISGLAARDPSTRARLLLYDVGIRAVEDHPVLGVGPDSYTVVFARYRPEGAHRILGGSPIETSPHSWVLYQATSAGLLGLAAYAATAGLALAMALSSGRPPVAIAAAAVIAQFLGTGLVTINDPGTEWLYWLALGTIAATHPVRPQPEPEARARPAGVLPWVLLGGAALLTLPAWQWMDASRLAERSQREMLAERYESAVSSAERAVSADGARAEYWNELGRAHNFLRQREDAELAFERGVDLAPYHSVLLTNLARAQVGRGIDGDAAALQRGYETARRAVAADPHTAYVHYALALAASRRGIFAEAVAESERGFLIDPPAADPSAYEVAARSYLALGRNEDARRWVDLGLAASPTAPLLNVHARILAGEGRYAEALDVVDRALALEPENAESRQLRAQLVPLVRR